MRSKTYPSAGVAVVAVTVALLLALPVAASAKLRAVSVKNGLNGPSGFTFAPDGTIWIPDKEQNLIYRVDPAKQPVLDWFPAGPGAYTTLRGYGSMWVELRGDRRPQISAIGAGAGPLRPSARTGPGYS